MLKDLRREMSHKYVVYRVSNKKTCTNCGGEGRKTSGYGIIVEPITYPMFPIYTL